MKTVSELCKQIKGIYNVEGNVETPITGIAADSREIEPGNLFVCISGVHVDGASFAVQAVEKGAVAVLTTKHLELPKGTVQIRVRIFIMRWKTWFPISMIIPAARCA